MKKGIIAGIMIFTGIASCFAQETDSSEKPLEQDQKQLEEVKNDHTKMRAEFSLFIGATIMGTKGKIKSSMIDYGFDDPSPGGWFGGPHSHPHITGSPSVDLELTFFVKQRSGITINGALSEYSEVFGYNENTWHMSVSSRVFSGSVGYTYRTSDLKNQFTLAPTFFNHKTVGPEKIDSKQEESKNKIGVYAGYSYKLVNKKNWFLNFKAGVRWAPPTTIGPFIQEINFGGVNGETYTTTFEETKVNLINLNVGLAIGLQESH